MTQGTYQCFRIGAGVLVAMGLAQLAGHFGSKGKPVNGMEEQMRMLMDTYRTNMMGSMRSTQDLYDGFSLAFVVYSLGLGALAFVLPPQKKMSIVYAGMLAVMTALSLTYWFAAPTVFLAVAALLFAASALLDR